MRQADFWVSAVQVRMNLLKILLWTEIFWYLQKIEAFEHRMYSHPLHKDSSLESVYAQYQTKAQVSSTYRKVWCIRRDNVQGAPHKVKEKYSQKTTGPLYYTHPKNAEIYQELIFMN